MSEQFEEVHQLYDSLPAEQKSAVFWLLENWALADRLTGIITVSEEEFSRLLGKKCESKEDYIFRMLLLYQKFKQEHPSTEDSTV